VENSREDRLKFAKHFERAQGWRLLDKFDHAAPAKPFVGGRCSVLRQDDGIQTQKSRSCWSGFS
jgi:hypothetical protein